jgi:hypothetical protein
MCIHSKGYRFDGLFDGKLGIYYFLQIASLAIGDLPLTDFECFPYWVREQTVFESKNQTFPLGFQFDF